MAKRAPAESANSEYTAEDIQVLGGREAVRRRPGMYIGSTDQRGLHHLVYEIVYNCVDEAMAGWCTRIQVTIHEDGSVTVQDNGKGFACPSKISTLAVNGKLGLVGLVERVTLLKGTFLVHSEPGMGTSLFAELPY